MKIGYQKEKGVDDAREAVEKILRRTIVSDKKYIPSETKKILKLGMARGMVK